MLSIMPLKNNFKIFTVQSGSMEPVISTGSVILTKEVPTYEIGDIITRKAGPSSKVTVTHRLVEEEEKNGEVRLRTKGDANEDADSETFSKEDIVGKAFYSIPFLGYPISFMKTTHGFILLVVIPATILIYEEMQNIKKEVKGKLKEHKLKKKKIKKPKERKRRNKTEKEMPEKNEYFITSIEYNIASHIKPKESNEKK